MPRLDPSKPWANRLAEAVLGLGKGSLNSKADDFAPAKWPERILGFLLRPLESQKGLRRRITTELQKMYARSEGR